MKTENNTVQNGYSRTEVEDEDGAVVVSEIVERVIVQSPVFCAACGTMFVASRPKGVQAKCVRCKAPTQGVSEPRTDGVYSFDEDGNNTKYQPYHDMFDIEVVVDQGGSKRKLFDLDEPARTGVSRWPSSPTDESGE